MLQYLKVTYTDGTSTTCEDQPCEWWEDQEDNPDIANIETITLDPAEVYRLYVGEDDPRNWVNANIWAIEGYLQLVRNPEQDPTPFFTNGELAGYIRCHAMTLIRQEATP